MIKTKMYYELVEEREIEVPSIELVGHAKQYLRNHAELYEFKIELGPTYTPTISNKCYIVTAKFYKLVNK